MTFAVGDLGGGVKCRAAAMLAWPAKRKLVKLAKLVCPRPRAEQPFGRGNDSHSGDPGCRPDRRGCAPTITGLHLPSVMACSMACVWRGSSRSQMITCQGCRGDQEIRRLARPAGRCEPAIQPVLWRPETTQKGWPAGPVKSLKPVSRAPGNRVAPGPRRTLPGPLGIADADIQVHVLRIGGIGPRRPKPRRLRAGKPASARRAGADDCPAARPAWS